MTDQTVMDFTPVQFTERQGSGELWQLLDVREAWEIEIASVEGSVNICMAEVPDRVKELDLERPIAVICHGGVRSARVANWLAGNGAARVANIAGGIDAWSMTIDASIPRY